MRTLSHQNYILLQTGQIGLPYDFLTTGINEYLVLKFITFSRSVGHE